MSEPLTLAAQRALDLLTDLSVAFHQVGSIRDHADPNDKTGWNVHGIETCDDLYCTDGVETIAALRAALDARPLPAGDDRDALAALIDWVHGQACTMPSMPHLNPDDSKCADIVRRVAAGVTLSRPEPLDLDGKPFCPSGYAQRYHAIGECDCVTLATPSAVPAPETALDEDRDALAALQALSDAATPGPWERVTEGSYDQHHAAVKAYLSVMATKAEDNPGIEFSDVTYIRAGFPNVAMVGNGPKQTQNGDLIIAAVNYVRAALAAAQGGDE